MTFPNNTSITTNTPEAWILWARNISYPGFQIRCQFIPICHY